MVSALNPPTAWMISHNCSSLKPYLNWSLTYLSSSMVSSPFPWRSYKLKLAPLPYSLNGFPWIKSNYYDSGCQSFQKLFEVQCITWIFSNFLKNSEDNVILFVQAESFGRHKNVFNINSSLSWVSIKWEQSVEFGNGIISEDGVFSSDFFGEDGLKILGLSLFSWHEISF